MDRSLSGAALLDFCERAVVGIVFLLGNLLGVATAAEPFLRTESIFPAESWHNHGSSIVETPNGDLFACWFHGSGERKADDVRIEAARRRRDSSEWSPRFTLADTPDYPDCNPALLVDARDRLWLFYPTILNNHWEGALLKFRVSSDWQGEGAPQWERSEVLHLSPGTNFVSAVVEILPKLRQSAATNQWSEQTRREVNEYLAATESFATNLLYRRLGWMPRAHPLMIGDRFVLGVYHDGFSFSLMAISDNAGTNWHTSSPLIGGGNIQPALVQKRDGTLVTYMRDNGPPPKRLLTATSVDRGESWSAVTDAEMPNPGSGADVISLRDGTWALIGNDTEEGRHRLSVWLSADEGKTWPWRRALENGVEGEEGFSYPSLIQARDGTLHATYSVHQNSGKNIRHATFNVEWIKAKP